ncbi:hypothetical protein IFM89_007574 [Coptis chinensis]|uniref:Uncharacterized protein n=1 Tax=Coptis chinensis TaxID=261450 RepID=A0A835I321_9MAGN|nr:hypothetical protein IFM89_007574 [Coptis chinensis]
MQRRVAGMLTILDDVKHRIQKSQSSGKKREAQLNSVDASLILSLLVCSRTRNHQNHSFKSLDGYRSTKRKMKEAQDENARYRAKVKEVAEEIVRGLERIHGFQQRNAGRVNVEMVEELSAVEHMLRELETKVSTDVPKGK